MAIVFYRENSFFLRRNAVGNILMKLGILWVYEDEAGRVQ